LTELSEKSTERSADPYRSQKSSSKTVPHHSLGEIEEHIMTELKQKLFKVTQRWRRTAINSRIAAKQIPNLLARGHMHGMSDGLEVAADNIDEVVNKGVPLGNASGIEQ